MCLNAGAYDLTQDLVDVSPADGVFVGEGVTGTDLHPAIAGTGNKEISFVLTSSIKCLVNGSRFITILDIKENDTELSLSTDRITACILDGAIDLNGLASVDGGTWSSTAPAEALNVGIINPVTAGTGELTATYAVELNGCVVTASLIVNITPSPNPPTLQGPATSCSGIQIQLSASGGQASSSYHWYAGEQNTSFHTGNTIQVLPQETTTYRVEMENAFGCLSEKSELTIPVQDIQLDFTATPKEVMVGERIAFSADITAVEYRWNFGDQLTSTEQNPSHIYFEQGVFDVTLSVVTEQGCADSLSKDAFIVVKTPTPEIATGIKNELPTGTANIYPTPFNDSFTLSVTSNIRQQAVVYLFSIQGTKVLEKPVRLHEGENNILFQHINLTDGIYVLRLLDENNSFHDTPVIKKDY